MRTPFGIVQTARPMVGMRTPFAIVDWSIEYRI
jgi:hypothetical protein